MADLFTFVGKIAIDAKDAETQIQAMIDKANELNAALGGTGGTGSTGTTSNSNPTAKKTIKSTNALFSAIDTAITVASGFAFKVAKDINSTGTEMMMTMEDAAASFSTKLGVSYEEGIHLLILLRHDLCILLV